MQSTQKARKRSFFAADPRNLQMVLSPKTAGHRWLLAKRLAMPAMCGLLDRTKYEGMHGEVIQEAHKFAAAVAPEDIDGHQQILGRSIPVSRSKGRKPPTRVRSRTGVLRFLGARTRPMLAAPAPSG